jgi:hypothetical protein
MEEYMLLIILKGEIKPELFSRHFPRNGKDLKFFFLRLLYLLALQKM